MSASKRKLLAATQALAEPDIGQRQDEVSEQLLGCKGAHSDETVDLEAGAHSTAPDVLTSDQVAERAFKSSRDRIFVLLCLSALVDTMGASLLSPAYAMAVSRAPGAVPPQGGIHPEAFPLVPLSFSLAINCITSALVLGGVFSSLTMGPTSDKFGRKPLILVGLLGGALGYFLMWLSAAVLRSYVLFVLSMFVNGLFSGTKSVMMSYFADIYSPEEFGKKQPIFGMFTLTGGTAGGIFGGIFIAATGSLWIAAWVGVVASLAFAVMVALVMPRTCLHHQCAPDASSKKTDAPQSDDDAHARSPGQSREEASTEAAEAGRLPTTVRRILLICIFAGAVDSLGDEGNRFARSTVMPQTFPLTKDPSAMSLIGSSNVIATALCMFLVLGVPNAADRIASAGLASAKCRWVQPHAATCGHTRLRIAAHSHAPGHA